jgi:ribose-phosphate pyrophosphokinase
MRICASSIYTEIPRQLALKLNISLLKVDYVRFGDSEIKPRVLENVSGEDVTIIGSTSNPVNENYMELFLLIDALKRSGAGKIHCVIPYFGYARQNQQHLPGEPVSAHVMVKFLESLGISSLLTIDIHEEQMGGFFSIPFTNLSALPLLAESVGKEIVKSLLETGDRRQEENTKLLVLSPDQGGVERTRMFRDELSDYIDSRLRGNDGNDVRNDNGRSVKVDEEIGIIEKKRNLKEIHSVEFVELTGDVSDKICIIPDDVIVSGGTIINAAKAVKEHGAKSVYLCATHADFIEGTAENLKNAPVEKIFVTDTIAIKDEWKFEKLSILSIEPLLESVLK